MSFIDGELHESEGRLCLRAADVVLPLPEELAHAIRAADPGSARCTLGVRPEAIEVAHPNGGPPSGWHVDVIEHLGADSVVGLRCGDTFVRGRVRPDSGFAPQAPVDVRLPASGLHLFDEQGESLLG
jgi:ABC-type sugar transport system ATPase subunit